MTIQKTCSCGQAYKEIPATSRLLNDNDPMDGFYWECPCRSTLYYPLIALLKKIDETLKG